MVAIIGLPNMGKSTLMNTLLGQDRAIVTEIPGTTRDYLEEQCRIKGRLIRLVDTAGIREASDKVERLGVERSLQLASDADLVLLLFSPDMTNEERDQVAAIEAAIDSDKILKILTKSDLGTPVWASSYLPISCKLEQGLEELEVALVRRVDGFLGKLSEEPFVSSARHLSAIKVARQDLEAFFAADQAGHYDELLAFELQNAARALSGILGTVDVEDILDKIFKDFCVGK
jgi:tRNA modification GTPase